MTLKLVLGISFGCAWRHSSSIIIIPRLGSFVRVRSIIARGVKLSLLPLNQKTLVRHRSSQAEHKRRGLQQGRRCSRRKRDETYHLWASIRRTQRAVIFNRSLTLVIGSNLYFSSSAIGRILANQYGNNAGSSGGGPYAAMTRS